jgi:outer membrane protein TolC
MKLKKLILFIAFIISASLIAQNPDSTKILSITDVLNATYAYHPLVKRASTFNDAAKQRILAARGAFDPMLAFGFSEKQFDEKLYYNIMNTQFNLPMWIGNLRGGMERVRGDLTNPEKITPFDGLYFVGLSVPLGQNLLFDERRRILRQSQLLDDIAEADQVDIVNQVLVSVARIYWEWFKAYQLYLNFLEARDLAQIRLDAIKDLVIFGNLAPIDSVEASINLQQRDIQLEQAILDLNNNRLFLSANLWDENENPVLIPDNFIPVDQDFIPKAIGMQEMEQLRTFAEVNHPDILRLQLNRKHLDYERRFRQEFLKPVVNLEYNPLSYTANPLGNFAFNNNNYTLGLTAAFPLLLRNARGNLKFTNTLIKQVDFQIDQTRATVVARFDAAYNSFITFASLSNRQKKQVADLFTLLIAEQDKFMNGESSVFLINARETNLVNARVRLVELLTNEAISYANLLQSSGTIGWNY